MSHVSHRRSPLSDGVRDIWLRVFSSSGAPNPCQRCQVRSAGISSRGAAIPPALPRPPEPCYRKKDLRDEGSHKTYQQVPKSLAQPKLEILREAPQPDHASRIGPRLLGAARSTARKPGIAVRLHSPVSPTSQCPRYSRDGIPSSTKQTEPRLHR